MNTLFVAIKDHNRIRIALLCIIFFVTVFPSVASEADQIIADHTVVDQYEVDTTTVYK